ncbi:MAG: hypothetical protein ACE5NJ_10175 [Thermodesulfobacteriota bacterium]
MRVIIPETYIYKQGFPDGIPSLNNAIAYSAYVFMRYAKYEIIKI